MSTATQQEQLLSAQFIAKREQLELASHKIFVGRMKGEWKSKRRGQSDYKSKLGTRRENP